VRSPPSFQLTRSSSTECATQFSRRHKIKQPNEK
jgi:hypothetical protein